MAASIFKNTLIEMEFELNRKDILHCRSLIVDIPSPTELVVLAPPPVAHGYAFKPGDQVDLYCSLLSTGDYSHTLHIKTTVVRFSKAAKSPLLYLKRNAFERKTALKHFFILRSNESILLQRTDPHGSDDEITATVHSVSLYSMHISTQVPLTKSGIWKGTLALNGTSVTIQGKIEAEEGSPLTHEHAATLHFIDMTAESRRGLAQTIEAIQKTSIESRVGTPYHGVLDRSNIQDPVILEHLVPRSQLRISLDFIEALGWILLILISFDVLMALPPGTNLFDRFFQVKRSQLWDQEQLRLVPYYLGAETLACISGFILHQYIYFRGNTRRRLTLWILTALSLLAFLAVQGHL